MNTDTIWIVAKWTHQIESL